MTGSMSRLVWVSMLWSLVPIKALALDSDACRTAFSDAPTALAWCMASLKDAGECRGHPKLTPTEEVFCRAAAEGYAKCGGLDEPHVQVACQAMAKGYYSDCEDGITAQVKDAAGEMLAEATSARALCEAYLKPVRSTCSKIRGGDFTRRACEDMVDARQFVKRPPTEEELQAAKAALNPVEAPDVSGVPEWAAEDYKRESIRVLAVSMTTDGKIGSIYFPEGRIRTTHAAGPEDEREHGNGTRAQFNVDEAAARRDFNLRGGGSRMRLYSRSDVARYWDAHDRWIANQLAAGKPGSWPSWATYVESPDDAPDAPSSTEKLFEVFFDINGRMEGWHPSRGTVVRFETNKQVIAVLEAAIKYIDDRGLTDPDERNMAFYNFVKSRLPNLEQDLNIRRPDRI